MPASLASDLPLSTPNRNLVRLTIVRGISWTGFLAGLVIGVEGLGFKLNVPAVIAVILLMGLINVATWWRLSWPRDVSHKEYLLHLLIDVIGLTLLFHYTGGPTNPFINYYLIPVTIAAATLPWVHAWVIAGISLLAYSLLMFFYHPVPQLGMSHEGNGLSLHTLGMWFNFALSAGLVTFFVYKMAGALRAKEKTLSKTRETSLRNEQVLAVATQAAGTAHELGTPLSTMAVLLSEMHQDAADNITLKRDIDLLRRQVVTCKSHLQRLVEGADRKRMTAADTRDARQWLNDVVQRWLVLRPDVSHRLDMIRATGSTDSSGETPWISVDTTLDQALTNLLNNAADANPDNIAIDLEWSRTEVVIDIRDHGPGVPLAIADQLGETFISTKSKGMGIGLFLSHATINRLGGGVSLYNHPQGGTLTEVILPTSSPDN